ncbi:hypothetical protein [Streptomyces mirabilis]|uniref:hypothetical protein n=1 Tax=Streptomyces mirabilis TaxID=68239 RepID=UPI002E34C7A7|nr:hypothetical protein [Streptomyces mirabilis]
MVPSWGEEAVPSACWLGGEPGHFDECGQRRGECLPVVRVEPAGQGGQATDDATVRLVSGPGLRGLVWNGAEGVRNIGVVSRPPGQTSMAQIPSRVGKLAASGGLLHYMRLTVDERDTLIMGAFIGGGGAALLLVFDLFWRFPWQVILLLVAGMVVLGGLIAAMSLADVRREADRRESSRVSLLA